MTAAPQPRRVLVLSRTLPSTNADGSAAYLHAVVQQLTDRGHRVHIRWVPLDGRPVTSVGDVGGATVSSARSVVVGERIFRVPTPGEVLFLLRRTLWLRGPFAPVRRRVRRTRAAASPAGRTTRVPALVRPLDRRSLGDLADAVRSQSYDVVIANYAPLTAALPEDGPAFGPRTVVLTHDVWHERLRDVDGTVDAPIATADGERALLEQADVVVAIQWSDAERFRSLVTDDVDVIVTPMPIAPSPLPRESIPGRCLYVGSQSPTNVDGMRWFLAEVWPSIRARTPTAELHVCGSVCRAIDDPPPGVRLLGHVDDLRAEYTASSVCVAPYLSGSGLKIKIVEAMSFGRAVVTSPAGLLGIEAVAADATTCCATPAETADAVVALLGDDDRRQRLEAAALDTVRTTFAPDVAAADLLAAIERPHRAVT